MKPAWCVAFGLMWGGCWAGGCPAAETKSSDGFDISQVARALDVSQKTGRPILAVAGSAT
ncbi:MAG: hypothetical protein ACYC35_07245 [Pirellulales bacterium]